MATIKSYTNLKQSKKLADILPIESADMYYTLSEDNSMYMIDFGKPNNYPLGKIQICWSLTALLDVLPNGHSLGKRTNGKYYVCMTHIKHDIPEFDNPVDACVAMIEKLHELNLL